MQYLLLFAALLLAHMASAQQRRADQVPPLAFAALQQQFPHVRQVQWEQAYGLYKANFQPGQTPQAALFSDYGDLEETGPNSLPSPSATMLPYLRQLLQKPAIPALLPQSA